MQQYSYAEFQKMIFLSPAFTPNYKLMFIRILSIFDFTGLSLPSFTPKSYRAHSWLSLSVYSSFLRIVDLIQVVKNSQQLNKIPTKIYLSDRDELISQLKLERWLERNRLSNWNIAALNLKPENLSPVYHLSFAPVYLGESEWGRLKTEIKEFLIN